MIQSKLHRLLLISLPTILLGLVLLGCRADDEATPAPLPPPAPTVAVAASATAVGGPVVVTVTPAPGDCDPPPSGWQFYVVQPGDTLQVLSVRAGVSTARIINENCLAGETLVAGEAIYLPPLTAATPCVAGRQGGWELVTVEIGDSLNSLAQTRNTGVADIMAANCLISDVINAGDRLYVPALPTPTPCPVPSGWHPYTVQPGDTLLALAAARNVTSAEIMTANCLTAPLVRPGDSLYLPPPPTATPVPPTVAPAQEIEPPAGPTQPPQAVAANNQPVGALQQSQQQSNAPQRITGDTGPTGGSRQGQTVSVASPFEEMGLLVSRVDLTPRLPGLGGLNLCKDLTTRKPVVELVASPELLLGERLFFVTCWFNPASAFVTRSDGIVWSIPVQTNPAYPLLIENEPKTLKILQTGTFSNPTAVVNWAALPFHPTGAYTLSLTGTTLLPPVETITVSTVFTVSYPRVITPSILIVPAISQPNTNVAVYYSNYPLTTNPEFTLLTTHTLALTPTQFNTYSKEPWSVTIDQPWPKTDRGWGFTLLASNNANLNLNGTYVISQVTATDVATPPGWLWFVEPEN